MKGLSGREWQEVTDVRQLSQLDYFERFATTLMLSRCVGVSDGAMSRSVLNVTRGESMSKALSIATPSTLHTTLIPDSPLVMENINECALPASPSTEEVGQLSNVVFGESKLSAAFLIFINLLFSAIVLQGWYTE